MMRRLALAVAFGAALLGAAAANAAKRDLDSPSDGPSHAIGSDANGCLAGGMALPLSGTGWETLRPQRNRYWGHTALIDFVRDMAVRTRPYGTLLIADMAQPRGGHMTSDHASHQVGLDVDILYRFADRPLTEAERDAPVMRGLVRPNGSLDPAQWGKKQIAVLKLFASDPRVERIFVNQAIKRRLCHQIKGDRDWLRVLRPWWGHDDHFHVRLNCPDGDEDCVPGKPIAAGDGCGAELDWWAARGTLPEKAPGPPQPIYRASMPAACRAILQVE